MMSENTDTEIVQELGDRLRQYRLQRNITQAQLAKSTGLHVNTVKNAELGQDPRLSTVVKVLRGLNRLDALESFLPPPRISPLQLAKAQNKRRQRARR